MASSLNGTGVTFSNGSTQAVAWPGNTGTVTSVATGNGLTGGTITGSGTISLDVYTGSTPNNASFPVGTVLSLRNAASDLNNLSATVYTLNNGSANGYTSVNGLYSPQVALAGTWRNRGGATGNACYTSVIMQRVA